MAKKPIDKPVDGDKPAPKVGGLSAGEWIAARKASEGAAHEAQHPWSQLGEPISADRMPEGMGRSVNSVKNTAAKVARQVQEAQAKQGVLVNVRGTVTSRSPFAVAIEYQPAVCESCAAKGSRFSPPPRLGVAQAGSQGQFMFKPMDAATVAAHARLKDEPDLLDAPRAAAKGAVKRANASAARPKSKRANFLKAISGK